MRIRRALRISSRERSGQTHRGIFALLDQHPGRRCGSAGSRRFQLALSAGFTCVSGGSRQSTAEPSERAQRRIPESTPIRSLLNVKAATLRHASKSPIQTAPAGRPAAPRLRSPGTKRRPALKGSTMTPIAPASDLVLNALTAMLAAMLGRPCGSWAVLERDSSRIQRRTSALHSTALERLSAEVPAREEKRGQWTEGPGPILTATQRDCSVSGIPSSSTWQAHLV
jgi:hypothetical protein